MPSFHAHGCTQCGHRYTDTCTEPFTNARCHACLTGHRPPVWDLDGRPKACCRSHARLITDTDTLNRFKLGGSNAWWRCLTCHRTHPFDPAGAIR